MPSAGCRRRHAGSARSPMKRIDLERCGLETRGAQAARLLPGRPARSSVLRGRVDVMWMMANAFPPMLSSRRAAGNGSRADCAPQYDNVLSSGEAGERTHPACCSRHPAGNLRVDGGWLAVMRQLVPGRHTPRISLHQWAVRQGVGDEAVRSTGFSLRMLGAGGWSHDPSPGGNQAAPMPRQHPPPTAWAAMSCTFRLQLFNSMQNCPSTGIKTGL
jgi:hypothetical protein